MLFVQSAGLKEKPCKHEDKAVAVATATALIYVKLIDFKGNKNKDGCKKVLPSERYTNKNISNFVFIFYVVIQSVGFRDFPVL